MISWSQIKAKEEKEASSILNISGFDLQDVFA